MSSESVNSAIREFLSSLITPSIRNAVASPEAAPEAEQQPVYGSELTPLSQPQPQAQVQQLELQQQQQQQRRQDQVHAISNGLKRSRSPDGTDTIRKKKAKDCGGTAVRNSSSNRLGQRVGSNLSRRDRRQRINDLDLDPSTRLIVRHINNRLRGYELRHLFEKYGKVLDVTMKNDGQYGFVQFGDPDICADAVRGENGTYHNGCLMQLEVCRGKPHALDRQRVRSRMDSYVPESRQRGARKEDLYRPRRDNVDDNDNDKDHLSRRRVSKGDDSRMGTSSSLPKPQSGVHINNASRRKDFPLPRRYGSNVPVVQIIAMSDADRPFVNYVENAFQNRSTTIHTLFLQQDSVSRDAIVKQMIYEGVKAIIIIERGCEVLRTIYLQVFDRSAETDTDAVRFDEYDNIHVDDAIAIVQHIQQPPILLPTSFGDGTTMTPPAFRYPPQPTTSTPSLFPAFVPPTSSMFSSAPANAATAPPVLGNADPLNSLVSLLQSNLVPSSSSPQPPSHEAASGSNPNSALLQALASLISNNTVAQQQQQHQQQQAMLLQQLLTQLTASSQQPQQHQQQGGSSRTNPLMAHTQSHLPSSTAKTGQTPLIPSVTELVGKIKTLSQQLQSGNGDIMQQQDQQQPSSSQTKYSGHGLSTNRKR
ncbi:hypothetical protein BDB00DRAFT_841934 [Zychaea mexicana]|uniref:uncharacterized protein n=1 Tax=Zychaea mexicana TaxID=64656 RepID=UPI0022FDD956|nr:uncharacterized protein BDB00DRAFT_841934 [Zychaea mexicana]KAI9489668.1 hypothetical protein BDB00DRAFT_841934 [Zychaea mexicana]